MSAPPSLSRSLSSSLSLLPVPFSLALVARGSLCFSLYRFLSLYYSFPACLCLCLFSVCCVSLWRIFFICCCLYMHKIPIYFTRGVLMFYRQAVIICHSTRMHASPSAPFVAFHCSSLHSADNLRVGRSLSLPSLMTDVFLSTTAWDHDGIEHWKLDPYTEDDAKVCRTLRYLPRTTAQQATAEETREMAREMAKRREG